MAVGASIDIPDTVAMSLFLALRPSDAPPPDGNLVRRGLLAIIREADAELPAVLHEDPGSGGHPWAVSDAVCIEGRWWARVTAIGARTCCALGKALRPGGLPATAGWRVAEKRGWRVRAVPVEALVIPPGRRETMIVVSLLSPTTFSSSDGGETSEPDGHALVGSWARRWAKHLGAAMLPTDIPSDRTDLRAWIEPNSEIVDGRLQMVTVRTTRGVRATGCVGAVVLRISGDPRDVAAIAAITRFATFSGTGKRLAHGFGQTVVGSRPASWEALLAAHLPLRQRPR